jgi:hypothetical protein
VKQCNGCQRFSKHKNTPAQPSRPSRSPGCSQFGAWTW